MSTLIVEIVPIKELQEHPNADRLEIAEIKGWQAVVKKGEYKAGDEVLFIPPDAILPEPLHIFLGVTNYCAALPKSMNSNGVRVKAARLRGVPSYGIVVSLQQLANYMQVDSFDYTEKDFVNELGITKWEPPIKDTHGDVDRDISTFPKYTSIENINNYPDMFEDGEQVVALEKYHGCLRYDSPVELEDGDVRLIKDILPGDRVKTYDVETGLFTSSKVNSVLIQEETDKLDWYELKFDSGKSLVCTEDHPILTTDGWITAKNLTKNHTIL